MENVDPAAARLDNIIQENHPELYFANGDVVLQANLSSDAGIQKFQMYCVHKAILSFHSVIFANLFADASAVPAQNYEGRPLVDMPDDAEDLTRLLSYIYRPSEYLLRPSHSDTPVELRGAVKLAGKYLLDNARADMIRRVTMDWPTTLDEWDILENERRGRRRMADSQYRSGAEYIALADRTPEPVAAIVFAQENGCTEILPAAFYRLASIEITDDWSGAQPAPGSVRHPRPHARWALCEKDNLVRWIKGRQALEDYTHDVAYELKDGDMLETAPSCRPWWIDNPELVAQAVEPDRGESPCLDYLRMLCALVWDKRSKHDPLAALLDLEIGNYPPELDKTCPGGLCQGCHRDFGRWVFRERRRLWNIIPAFFDL